MTLLSGSIYQRALVSALLLLICVTLFILKCKCNTYRRPFRISAAAFDAGPSSQLNLTVAEVIERQGFRAKTYSIESHAGYVVAATRIINPLAEAKQSKFVVVVHHGFKANPVVGLLVQGPYARPHQPDQFMLLEAEEESINRRAADAEMQQDSGDNNDDDNDDGIKFIPTDRLKNNCLGYYLSNLNYDVWLLHGRGVTYDSSGYVNNSLADPELYWNFNIDDQSLYDLPRQIDFIRYTTNQDKVAYIGFSQSTIMMFQLLSYWPAFANTRLAVYIAIGPEIYKNHARGTQGQQTLQDEERYKSLNAPSCTLSECIDNNRKQLEMCPNQTESNLRCRPQYDATVGPESVNIYNKVFMSNYRSPVSSKSAGQMVQYVQKGVFNKYDFGVEGNLKYYNQETAPIYNFSAVKFNRIALVRSTGNDYVADAIDQERLINELTVPLYRDIVTPSDYDHFSYFLAYDCYEHVNRPIYETLKDAFAHLSDTQGQEWHV